MVIDDTVTGRITSLDDWDHGSVIPCPLWNIDKGRTAVVLSVYGRHVMDIRGLSAHACPEPVEDSENMMERKMVTPSVLGIVVLLMSASVVMAAGGTSASTSDSSDNGILLEAEGLTTEDIWYAFESLNASEIHVYTDEKGTHAKAVNTFDKGRFGYDKVNDKTYRLYLDSATTSLIVGGLSTVAGAAIGSLFAPVVGTACGLILGAALGVAINTAINEGAIDTSHGIVADVYFKNAVVLFGVMIFPGEPTISNVRPQ